MTLKRYKGKLYLTNEKTMCMHFITKRSIKIHLECYCVYLIADCLEPPMIDRAIISVGRTVEGTTRTYTCNTGTNTEGTPTITCQANGIWTSTDLYCRRTWS